MKVRMPVAMMPGSAIGSTTWITARNRLAPSVIAASSRSIGIDWKKVRNIHSAKGRLNAQ